MKNKEGLAEFGFMVVKIRFPERAPTGRVIGSGGARVVAPAALMAGGLFTLAAVACLTLAAWRLTSDLGWTGEFAITEGLLSHWQVWMTLTIGTGVVGVKLLRIARAREAASVPADH
ncbi:hypothetical protein [Nevskia soli]|uniref:hypothetical protein n=1 Tax=Nevskia soli TaxID=418856 RepID=UPI0015D72456|nr:hypothetical protein [Nevskia soli]